MNCQDIARVLDERDVEGLSARETSQVTVHLAGCRDCARDWDVHVRLRDQVVPAVPTELRAGFVPATGSAASAAQPRGRFIVIGALVAVAAAAAMVSVQMHRSPAPQQVGAAPTGLAAATVTEKLTVDEPPSQSPPAVAGPESLPPMPTQQVATPVAKPSALEVMLLPARHESEDVAARPAIDAFHQSLYLALRSLPDVRVKLADGRDSGRAAHRITVLSPGSPADASRRLPGMGATGRSGPASAGGGRVWAVAVMLDAAGRTNPGHTASVDQFVDELGVPVRRSCNANLSVDHLGDSLGARPARSNSMPEMCTSVQGLAAWLIAALRPQPAPLPDDMAQVVARLAGSVDPHLAYGELLRLARQQGTALDAAAIDALVAYLRGLAPEQRMVGLIQLRGLRQPGLLTPLLEMLRQEEDEKLRLEVISTLVANFPDDARVRGALESVALEDPSRMVRMAARRTHDGDAQWQEFVLVTLASPGLGFAERLAPAKYDAQYPGGLEKLPSYLGSERGTQILMDMFQELRAAASVPPAEVPSQVPAALESRIAELGGGTVDVRAGPQGVFLLGSSQSHAQELHSVLTLLSLANPSAALELRISILMENPRAPDSLLINALQGLAPLRKDLRVNAILDDIAAGRAGQHMRDLLLGLKLAD